MMETTNVTFFLDTPVYTIANLDVLKDVEISEAEFACAIQHHLWTKFSRTSKTRDSCFNCRKNCICIRVDGEEFLSPLDVPSYEVRFYCSSCFPVIAFRAIKRTFADYVWHREQERSRQTGERFRSQFPARASQIEVNVTPPVRLSAARDMIAATPQMGLTDVNALVKCFVCNYTFVRKDPDAANICDPCRHGWPQDEDRTSIEVPVETDDFSRVLVPQGQCVWCRTKVGDGTSPDHWCSSYCFSMWNHQAKVGPRNSQCKYCYMHYYSATAVDYCSRWCIVSTFPMPFAPEPIKFGAEINDDVSPNAQTCVQCGDPFEQSYKYEVWCDSECRDSWFALTRSRIPNFACVECGEYFWTLNRVMFCSPRCHDTLLFDNCRPHDHCHALCTDLFMNNEAAPQSDTHPVASLSAIEAKHDDLAPVLCDDVEERSDWSDDLPSPTSMAAVFRECTYGPFDWSINTNVSGTAAFLDLPGSYLLNYSSAAYLKKGYFAFRTGFRATLRFNNDPYSVGALCMYWEPAGFSAATTQISYGSVLNLPHVIAKLGSAGACALDIPWSIPQSFGIVTPNIIVYGSLRIGVWNKLKRPSTESATKHFHITITPLEPNFAIKVPINALPQSSKVAMTGPFLEGINRSNGATPNSLRRVEVREEESETMSCADSGHRVVALRPFNSMVVNPQLNHFGTPSLTNIHEMCRIWSRLMIFEWNSTHNSGNLFIIPVNPVNATVASSERESTNLSHWGHFFSQWRGSVEYKFEIIASPFTRGELAVYFDPNGTTSLYNNNRNLPEYSHQIGQNDDVFAVRAPWTFPTDYAPVMFDNLAMTGCLIVQARHPLTFAPGAPTTVDINVYIRAGPDFEFATPVYGSYYGEVVQSDSCPLGPTVESPRDSVHSFYKNDLCKRGYMYHNWDVRELLRMPHHLSSQRFTAATNDDFIHIAQTGAIMPSMMTEDFAGMLRPYLHCSGGVKYRILASGCTTGTCRIYASVNGSLTSYYNTFEWMNEPETTARKMNVCTSVNLVNNQSVDFKVPGMHNLVHVPMGRWHSSPGYSGVVNFYTMRNPDVTLTANVMVDDDWMPHFYLPLPKWRVTSTRSLAADEDLVASRFSNLSLFGISADVEATPQADSKAFIAHEPAKDKTDSFVSDVTASDSVVDDLSRSRDLRRPVYTECNFVKRRGGRKPRRQMYFASDTETVQGWTDILSAIVSAFNQVRTTLAAIPKFAADSAAAAAAGASLALGATKLKQKLAKKFDKCVAFLTALMDDGLPLITAVHTFYYGEVAMKTVAVASIVNILRKYVGRHDKQHNDDEEEEDQEINSDAEAEDLISRMEAACTDGSFDAFAKSRAKDDPIKPAAGPVNLLDPDDEPGYARRHQHDADRAADAACNIQRDRRRFVDSDSDPQAFNCHIVDSRDNLVDFGAFIPPGDLIGKPPAFEGDARPQGLFNLADLEVDPFSFRIGAVVPSLFKSVLGFYGFFLGPGYEKYIRRTCGVCKDAGFKSFLLLFFHSFLYLIHGDVLNQNWESAQLHSYVRLFNIFTEMDGEGYFTFEKMEDTTLPRLAALTLQDNAGKPIAATPWTFLVNLTTMCRDLDLLSVEMTIPNNLLRVCEIVRTRYKRLHKLRQTPKAQPQPVCSFLCGDAGTGKSLLSATLIPRIVALKLKLGKKEWQHDVYVMPFGENKFFEGYDGQPFVVMDEFEQSVEGNDPANLIRLVNAIPAAMNKAAVDAKDEVFVSKFVNITSNMTSMQTALSKVRDATALVRRITFAYRVVVAPNYGLDFNGQNAVVRQLDAQKFCGELANCDSANDLIRLCNDAFELYPVNLYNGVVSNNRVLFSTYIAELLKKHQERSVDFNALSDALTRIEADPTPATSPIATASSNGDTSAAVQMWSARPLISFREGYSAQTTRNYDEGQTMLQKWGATFLNSDNWSYSQCSAFMDTVLVMNDEELGFEAEELKRLVKIRSPYPFNICINGGPPEVFKEERTTIDANFFDTIYRLSRFYRVYKARFQGFMKMCAGLAAVGLGLVVVFKTVSFIINSLLRSVEIASMQSVYDTARYIRRRKVEPKGAPAVPQGDTSDVLQNQERIRKNLREVFIFQDGINLQRTQCLMLDGRTMLLPNHMYEHFRNAVRDNPETAMFISNRKVDGTVSEPIPFYLSASNSCQLEYFGKPIDLRIVKLRTETVSSCRNIWNFLADDLSPIINKNQTARIINHEGRVVPGNDYDVTMGIFSAAGYAPGHVFINGVPSSATVDGDCGLPYLSQHPRMLNSPIIAFHCCLYKNANVVGAAPIHRNSVQAAFDSIKLTFVPPAEKEIVQLSVEPAPANFSRHWNSTMELVGQGTFGKWKASHFTPTETKFVRVTYRGQLLLRDEDCNYRPASQHVVHLPDLRVVHPLISNAQKYACTAGRAIPPGLHEYCVDHFVSKFEIRRQKHVYSLHEAINGNEIMQPLNMNTGVGYWSSFGFKAGKKQFFKALPQETGIGQELEPVKYEFSPKALQHEIPLFGCTFVKRLENAEKLCREGIAPLSLWISTTKDELLKEEKCLIGKTRVFEQPDLCYVLLVRRYFGAFLDYYKARAGFVFYHGIGMDREEAWRYYAEGFLRNSDKCIAEDFKNYDGTVGQPAFRFFEDVVLAYYEGADPAEQRARVALIECLRNPYHIMRECISTSHKGNKSGNPFTDVFNSITNTYIHYIAFCLLVTPSAYDLRMFDSKVRMLTYGDDVAQSVTPDVLEKYNGQSIKAILHLLGYEVTSALKAVEMEHHLTFDQMTFLKSPFVCRDSVWWAPLPMPDILKELKYRPKQFVDDESDLQLRFQVVQRFICHHGPDALRDFKWKFGSKVPRSWLTVNYNTVRNEIYELQRKFVSYDSCCN